MTTLKTFTVAPEQDSVRTAFSSALCAAGARLTLERRLAAFPEYVLKQDGFPVAIIRGKEMVVGGEHFAVIPLLPLNWAETGLYAHHPDNVPYWDGEQRLKSLNALLSNLSQGWTIPAALDDAVDAEDDEFFASIPKVAYTGQRKRKRKPEPTPPSKIYPWTFWYRNRNDDDHQVILEATYEDAQRVWDKLSTTLDMTSKRP